jgi:membrane-bound lytic murein transglycosylase D
MFGDWLTVLAAYNCGEGRVLKVISGQQLNYLDRFWDLYHKLPYETARYVPRFLATLHIIKDPQKYGFELGENVDKKIAPLYEFVKTSKPMRLQDIALNINTSEDMLNALNPELRYKATPDREYNLRVPPETAEKLAAAVNDIPVWEKPQPVRTSPVHQSSSRRPISVVHKVRRGETIASIARRYHTSVATIRSSNHFSRTKGLRRGQCLVIPLRSSRYAKSMDNEDLDSGGGTVTMQEGRIIRYKVKRGDTLTSVAKDFGTSSLAIKRINRLKGNKLRSGQVIKIPKTRGSGNEDEDTERLSVSPARKTGKVMKIASQKKGSAQKTYRVKQGDSLNKIARANNVSLDKLKELNKFAREDTIRPGQIIVVK